MKIVEQNKLDLIFVVLVAGHAGVPLQHCLVTKTTKMLSSLFIIFKILHEEIF